MLILALKATENPQISSSDVAVISSPLKFTSAAQDNVCVVFLFKAGNGENQPQVSGRRHNHHINNQQSRTRLQHISEAPAEAVVERGQLWEMSPLLRVEKRKKGLCVTLPVSNRLC